MNRFIVSNILTTVMFVGMANGQVPTKITTPTSTTSTAQPTITSLLPPHQPDQLIPKDEESVMFPVLYETSKINALISEYNKAVSDATKTLQEQYTPKITPLSDQLNTLLVQIKKENGWGDDVKFDLDRQGFFKEKLVAKPTGVAGQTPSPAVNTTPKK